MDVEKEKGGPLEEEIIALEESRGLNYDGNKVRGKDSLGEYEVVKRHEDLTKPFKYRATLRNGRRKGKRGSLGRGNYCT